MHGASAPTVALRRRGQDTRKFLRMPVVIPLRAEILRASHEAMFASVPGALLNVGCGGGRVRFRWELPPRTRLFISLPAGTPLLRLLAEVSWMSQPSGREPGLTEYGLRWVEPLSSSVLQSVLLRQGLAGRWEAAHVPGT